MIIIRQWYKGDQMDLSKTPGTSVGGTNAKIAINKMDRLCLTYYNYVS